MSNTIQCPACGTIGNRVTNSRATVVNKKYFAVRRRRRCLFCRKAFTTYEINKEALIAMTRKEKDYENGNNPRASGDRKNDRPA